MGGCVIDEYDAQLISEAQSELARYLSDEIAPMIFAGSAEVLFQAPPEIMARGIHAWVGIQLQGPRPSPVADYLLHSARKVHHLGELELIPREDLKVFLSKLSPMLIGICPESDRAELAANLKVLDADFSGDEGMAARISVSRRPAPASSNSHGADNPPVNPAAHTSQSGGGEGGPVPTTARTASRQLEGPPEAPPATPTSTSVDGRPVSDAETGAQIDRLNLLLDRWERIAARTGTPTADAGIATPQLGSALAHAEGALLSRIIDEVASSARSSTDLASQLRYLGDIGLEGAGSGVFRLLSGTLPDWAPTQAPSTDDEDAPPLSGAAATMKKVVELARDPAELTERFRELISSAVTEFNNGSLGRAVTVVDLAQRMIAQKEVDASLSANIIDQTSEELDDEQLRRYAENEDKRLLLRRIMAFFPPYQVDSLIRDLMEEERRDRRRLILRLLMIHGAPARERAIDELRESLSGNVPHPWFVQRNLIYLMRSIPPDDDQDIDREIDLLIRASIPGGELPLLREALTALGQIDHPRAISTLIARVSDLEDVLQQKDGSIHSPEEIQSLLDTAIKAMIRFDSRDARQCILSHGMKRRPELGNTLGRLAMLGSRDLSDDPATVAKIIEAIKNELPVKVFGVPVKSSKRAQNLEALFEALSGTDTPKVRRVYDSIVRKFPGERFANSAARCLTKLGSLRSTDESSPDHSAVTSLSGDLALFGLPNLMQNLADSRVEGTLTVLDDAGNSVASITLADGMMVDASYGDLTGETAVYQLLEKPIVGRFIFVNQPVEPPDAGDDSAASRGIAVMSLLMEGMRRYDEFNRAAAVVGDNERFKATGLQPTGLPDEDDADFVNGIWVQATRGMTPVEIEQSAKVDGYRIFRLFEHWLNEGAIQPKA